MCRISQIANIPIKVQARFRSSGCRQALVDDRSCAKRIVSPEIEFGQGAAALQTCEKRRFLPLLD